MQDLSITPDNIVNSLIYGSPFYVTVYTSYRYSKMVRFLLLKIIGIFDVLSCL